MNDRPEPSELPATSSGKSPFAANQPRRLRVAALLTAAAPVAVALVALAPPMAAPIQIWPHPGAAPADKTLVQPTCDIAIPSGALNTMKWPECGGD